MWQVDDGDDVHAQPTEPGVRIVTYTYMYHEPAPETFQEPVRI